jgi:DNA-binding NarL/FixJ family response regulator
VASGEERLSRVAALGQTAQVAVMLGQSGQCLAALDEQRAAAGDDQPSLVWALTSAAGCRAVLGDLRRARQDLIQVRQACNYIAPLLAEPFWRFADAVCNWLGDDWMAAEADAAVLDSSQVSPVTPALAEFVTALRTELLRGLGRTADSRATAERLTASPMAEINAWAMAGLDIDQDEPARAMRRLEDARGGSRGGAGAAALPLVLHRLAETAFSCGDRDVTAHAAAALAELDQAAPLAEIMAGLAAAYATGDPQPARQAQRLAKAEGAAALTAEALFVRGQVGDQPDQTFAAAHAAWQQIGAPAKARSVAAAMRAAGLPVPSVRVRRLARAAAEGPAPLTARERTLARLVHEGHTNQQIARAMHVSVKTVEAYLTRVYRKTACSSRVELAVAVTERRIQVGESGRAAKRPGPGSGP